MRTIAGIVLCLLVGCTSAPRFTGSKSSVPPAAGTGSIRMNEEGVASYYGDEFNGRSTANGEIYDMNALTAAHRTLPFNTTVRVTNALNGKSVKVRINDRGPFKDNRIIDLSVAAAKEIEMIGPGTASVRLEVLEVGPLTKKK